MGWRDAIASASAAARSVTPFADRALMPASSAVVGRDVRSSASKIASSAIR